MAFPIRTPRLNNNDDTVRLSARVAAPGTFVRAGDPLAEVETDKATVPIEADRAGYVLAFLHEVGEKVAVGSVLAWMGDSADEPLPEAASAGTAGRNAAEPTLRAALLLAEFALEAGDVVASGERLSAADVEAHVAARGLVRRQPLAGAAPDAPTRKAWPLPDVASDVEDMSVTERGMLRTVAWHRDEAVTGYVEIAFDVGAWEAYAAAFQNENRLLMNPLLSLMAYQLVGLCQRSPKYNGTVHGERKVLYRSVNIGFTVQGADQLYLVVVAGAEQMTAREFALRSTTLQKAAMRGKLEPSATSGATIGFTSMARWAVTRHLPVLPPYTSLMVAHSAPVNGSAALGASYDHRLLTGADVVAALNFLKEPPSSEREA